MTHGNKGGDSTKTGRRTRLDTERDLLRGVELLQLEPLFRETLTSMLILVSELDGSDQPVRKRDLK